MDDSVHEIWRSLGLPGLIDVHTHFMPKSVMDKVWKYFDDVGPLTGRPWPITYRTEEQQRLATLRGFGVRAFTSLVYAHKPGMAAWLNQWAAQFAAETPDCLSTATFFPETGAAGYVADAIAGGARVFKAHVQVGDYHPADPLLDEVWGTIAEAGTPVIIHCGSGPAPGRHTGPEPVRTVLRRHPKLRLIIAHMGMPEYSDFLDICEQYDGVRLDTTMAFTAFVEENMPFPPTERRRLLSVADRILFGSDFPNIPYPYADAIEVLAKIDGVDDDWLRRVLYGNAAELFGLMS
ncbi:putative TIM-barrel fold metal-dependent hydrolase [Mycobacterium sp. MAA66]|uniref:amidohydrolase family protein n=1 Tax=Mycobacterium sp. MAA66 TaxID=3156297 RepID=UPI003514835A